MNSAIKRTNASAEAVVSQHRPILSAMLAPKSIAVIGATQHRRHAAIRSASMSKDYFEMLNRPKHQ